MTRLALGFGFGRGNREKGEFSAYLCYQFAIAIKAKEGTHAEALRRREEKRPRRSRPKFRVMRDPGNA